MHLTPGKFAFQTDRRYTLRSIGKFESRTKSWRRSNGRSLEGDRPSWCEVLEVRRSMRFAGKTIFITGGGSGIGAAAAQRFAKEGGLCTIVDVDGNAARGVAAELPDALPLEADVSNADAVENAISTTVDRFGRIDVIFNNAGVPGDFEPLHESSLANWRRVLSVNGDGVFHVLKYGIASMLRTGGGSIVNTASVSGLVASGPNLAAYMYTKAGVASITRAAACDYATRGIRVNAVAPAQVLTPLIERVIANAVDPAADREARANRNPIPGFIMPGDVAAAVAFLASADARFITGVVLPVDGGYLAR